MIQRKILTIALAVFALAIAASPALAAKEPHRYSPRHGAKCHRHYKRVVKQRRHHPKKVFCVKRAARKHRKAMPQAGPTFVAPTSASTPQANAIEKAKLHAHLDPAYTRNPLDPFEVTYAYSASASQEVAGTAARTAAVEEPAPLPSGVLALYSDGRLECAINVGSGVEGSECPVDYEALGEHTVTTIYTSGEESATETETETIEPLVTETTLSMSYDATTPVEVGISSGLFRIGSLATSAGSSPAAATAQLGCGEGSVEHLTASGCYQVDGSVYYVYRQDNGACTGGIWISKAHPEPGESGGAGEVNGERFSAADIEGGAYHLRASVSGGGGYFGSEATAPIRFTPGATPDC